MLLLLLKERTRSVHQESEKKMIARLKKIRTTEDYIRFLTMLYGYYHPLEELLRPWLTDEILPDMEKRRRTEFILWDIRELGGTAPIVQEGSLEGLPPEELPLKGLSSQRLLSEELPSEGLPLENLSLEDLPRIDSLAKALGAFYVLEGSTLGGRIIAEMLCRQLGSDKGLSFFNGYGKETENMWQTFKTWMERPYTEEEENEILTAATETFITFKNWIDQHELQPQL